jgi:hypothetical protein
MKKALFITLNDINNLKTGGSVCSVRNLGLISNYYKTDTYILKSNKFEKFISTFMLLFPPFSINDYIRLKKLIKKNKYEILFFDTSLLGIFIKYVTKKQRIKSISFFQNVGYDYVSVRFGRNILKYPYLFLAFINETLTLKHSTVCITLNERDKKRLNKIYNINPEYIIPITLKSEKQKELIISEHEKHKTDIPKLLFVGSLNRANYISVKWFVDNVMPHINKAELLVVGKDFETKAYELSRENVKVIGTVDKLDEYYYKSVCVISPIFEGAGMKVKIAEALMFGCTIFGTEEAFEGYDLADESVTIKCNNSKDFIEKINNFISKTDKLKSVSKSIQIFENSYSNKRAFSDFSEIIASKFL